MFCAYSLGIKGRSSISRTESRDKVPIEFRWLCRTESRDKLPIEFDGIEVLDPSSSSIFTTEGIELSKSARLWRLANCRRSVIDPRLFRLARRLLIESWCFCASGVSSPYGQMRAVPPTCRGRCRGRYFSFLCSFSGKQIIVHVWAIVLGGQRH